LRLFPGSDSGGELNYLGHSNTEAGNPSTGSGTPISEPIGDTLLLDPSGFIRGFYSFEYCVNNCGVQECQTAKLQITEDASSGTPTNPTFCTSQNQTINLFDYLTGETPGGTWTQNPATPTADLSGSNVNLGNLSPGIYYYDYEVGIIGEAGYEADDCIVCVKQTTLSITIIEDPQAGTADPITLCVSCGQINLIDYVNDADPGGSWTQISGITVTITDSELGTVNIGSAGTRTFRYSVGSGNCEDTLTLTVFVLADPNAGTGNDLTICENSSGINLFSRFSGEDPGGYLEVVGSAPPVGELDLLNGTYRPEVGDSGTYTFRYVVEVGTSVCGINCRDTADFVLTVDPSGDPGPYFTIVACQGDTIDLENELTAQYPGLTQNGEFEFVVFGSGCTGGGNADGVFSVNGGPQGTVAKFTNLGSDVTVGNFQDPGCYYFSYWTPTVFGTCANRADGVIEVTDCCGIAFSIAEIGSQLCASGLTGCGGNPITYQWAYSADGSSYSNIGTSSCVTPTNTGLYRLRVTCNGCTETQFYFWTEACSVSANITESSGTLSANASGCSGTVTYQWQYSLNGSTGWINLGTSATQFASQGNGTYRVIVDCPDGDGCSVIDTFLYTAGCNLSVNITASGNTLTANTSGGTAPISYQWLYSASGLPGTYTIITGATSSSYVAPQDGWYKVEVEDNLGCQAEDEFELDQGCSTTVSLSLVNGGTQIQATIGGTGSPVITWQYSPTGTGWTSLPSLNGQILITPPNGSGFYRVIVYDGSIPNCPAQDTIEFTLPCSGGVTITEQTCGNTDVDIIFMIDESSSVDSVEWAQMKSNIDATIDAIDSLTSVNARFACAQWSGTGQHNLAVNFTSNPLAAKSFSRNFNGGTDMSDATDWLKSELDLGNISFRASAAKHIVYFTDGADWFIQNCTNSLPQFRKCVGGIKTYDSYDDLDAGYNVIYSLVRYRNGGSQMNSESDAVAAMIADLGGSYNGDVDQPADPSQLTPRRLYQLTFGDPVPELAYDVTCVELTSSVTGCGGSTVLYTWEYRANPGGSWVTIASTPDITVTDEGEYRLTVNCGNCTYTSNIITI
jgi:hypothetical protein